MIKAVAKAVAFWAVAAGVVLATAQLYHMADSVDDFIRALGIIVFLFIATIIVMYEDI